MTFSEFGRQIASNGSDGTDHGEAAPLLVFGACISGGVVGSDPIIGTNVDVQDAVPMEIDFRDVYASVLKDWFEVPEAEIQTIFDHVIMFYPILGACNLGIEEEKLTQSNGILFPNPAASVTTLKMKTENERVRIQVVDINGIVLLEVIDKNLSQDTHLIPIGLEQLSQGNYFVQVIKPSGEFSLQLSKVK